jgi:hypothetical protein
MRPASNWTDQTPLTDSSLSADGAALPSSRTPTSSCCWSDLAFRHWINHITGRCHLSHSKDAPRSELPHTQVSILSNLSPECPESPMSCVCLVFLPVCLSRLSCLPVHLSVTLRLQMRAFVQPASQTTKTHAHIHTYIRTFAGCSPGR